MYLCDINFHMQTANKICKLLHNNNSAIVKEVRINYKCPDKIYTAFYGTNI